MAKVRAAKISTDGLLVGVEEVEESELTAQHLPQFAELDLDPARGYRWVPTPEDQTNPLGGRWDPLPRKTPERKFEDAEPLPALACFFLAQWKKDPASLPARTLAWLDQYARSFDFRAILESNPDAQDYYRVRKLANKTGG